jgi:hypothetical protein
MNIIARRSEPPLKHTPMVVDGVLAEKLDKYGAVVSKA